MEFLVSHDHYKLTYSEWIHPPSQLIENPKLVPCVSLSMETSHVCLDYCMDFSKEKLIKLISDLQNCLKYYPETKE